MDARKLGYKKKKKRYLLIYLTGPLQYFTSINGWLNNWTFGPWCISFYVPTKYLDNIFTLKFVTMQYFLHINVFYTFNSIPSSLSICVSKIFIFVTSQYPYIFFFTDLLDILYTVVLYRYKFTLQLEGPLKDRKWTLIII